MRTAKSNVCTRKSRFAPINYACALLNQACALAHHASALLNQASALAHQASALANQASAFVNLPYARLSLACAFEFQPFDLLKDLAVASELAGDVSLSQ